MGRHRRDQDDAAIPPDDTQTSVLPSVGEQTGTEPDEPEAGDEFGPRKRVPRRVVISAVAGVLVAGGFGSWILSGRSNPAHLLEPPGTDGETTGGGKSVTEGFGEASVQASPSPSARTSPRVPPDTSPTPGQPGVEPPPPPAGQSTPLAHYRFNESSGTSASDATGGGRTATISGGAPFVAGRLDNAIDLNGSNQYVTLPSGILNGAKEFTVAVWVHLDSANTWTRIFDFGSSTSVNMFLTPRSDAGTARYAITTGGNGGEQRINAPFPLATGTWTHVAVTLSDGVGTLYVNRSTVARTTGMTLAPASLGNTSRNWIGRSQYSADPYLNGRVDDLRLYTRALPASEIATLP